MVFDRSDLYTSSGAVQLFNSWTPYVSKFDTSTFYNWEQDNLPLYDIEERTYENWEQLGFPTSSVDGFSLTVSADAPLLTLQQNSNIFIDLSSCIAAIPKVIRFPVLVEVCNFGDLGKLELNDFKFSEGGSLEIVNRNFSKVYNTSGAITSTATAHGSVFADKYSSADVSATLFSGIANDACVSGVNIGTRVCNSIGDTRLSSVNTVLYPGLTQRRAHLVVGLADNKATIFPGAEHVFGLTPYDTTALDATIPTHDVSSNDPWGGTIKRPAQGTGASDNVVGGGFYGNHLSKISIKNCQGPVYVRNFSVDGEAGIGAGTNRGIEVTNSEAVLENCSVARCNESGFHINNSEVILSRFASAYRIYKREAANLRTDTDPYGNGFLFRNSTITVSAINNTPGDYQASGSDVVICASRCRTGIQQINSTLYGGYGRTETNFEGKGGILALELNSNIGWSLKNSIVSQPSYGGLIDLYGNKQGISLENSELYYNNLCVESTQNEGIVADNSKIILSPNTFSGTLTNTSSFIFGNNGTAQTARKQVDFFNNGVHLDIKNNSTFGVDFISGSPYFLGQMSFTSAHGAILQGDYSGIVPAINIDNGSTAEFIHSKMIPRDTTHTNSDFAGYGTALRANNNSTASFYGTGSGCTFIWGHDEVEPDLAGLYANKNSTINLHGPTLMAEWGVNALVENNSTLNISPPLRGDEFAYETELFNLADRANHTSIELHSVRACLVANKNSTINLRDIGDYHASWEQSVGGDAILASNQGDYPTGSEVYDLSNITSFGSLQFYPNPNNKTTNTTALTNKLTNAAGLNFTIPDLPKFDATTNRINQMLYTTDVLSGADDFWDDIEKITLGGTCLRAVDNSQVNVLNVHFPIGPVSGSMNSPYYDTGQCQRLMIWNIADTSRLNASYCSVSGLYPGDVDHHGPSALWVSSSELGEAAATYVPASGAPSGTPDTGTLSVLDSFGAGSGVWIVPSGVGVNDSFGRYYPVMASDAGNVTSSIIEAGLVASGNATQHPMLYGAGPHASNNKGIFRLYFSPKSETKLLQHDLSGYEYGTSAMAFSGEVGIAYQVFAQGYNMSGPLSSLVATQSLGETGVQTSSMYPNLLKLSHDLAGDSSPDTLNMSGFYYCKEFVEDNPMQCLLDESASNTFANAKNASTGSSGRPRKVTLYRSRANDADRVSEASEGDTVKGFKSANIFDLKRDN